MAFNSFMKIFQPKDRVFYTLFEEVVDTVGEMSEMLKRLIVETQRDKRFGILNEIENAEHKNDDTTHRIYTELGRTFITPFDREDIHYLASALDDIADYIFACGKKINFYRVNPNDTGMQKLAEIVHASATEVRKAVGELRDMKNMRVITESLIRINSLENQADDMFDMSIERLFATEPDAKEVIKKREIYQSMEMATDKCEDAANVIESIIVKYA